MTQKRAIEVRSDSDRKPSFSSPQRDDFASLETSPVGIDLNPRSDFRRVLRDALLA